MSYHALSGFFNQYYGDIKKIYDDPTMDKVLGIGEEPKKEVITEEPKQEKETTINPDYPVFSIVKKNPVEKTKSVEATVAEKPDPFESKNETIVDVVPIEEDKIAMSERKTCPVSVIPTVEETSKVKVENTNKPKYVDESLNHFINDLTAMGVRFNNPKRVSTGLVEVQLVQNTGNTVLVTLDIDSKIYRNGVVIFFIGRINPLDEYVKPGIVMNFGTISSVIMGTQIDPNFYVPEHLALLNRMLDIRSLKETDKVKRDKVLAKASKALAELNDEIVKTANGEPFRFVFAKYKSEEDFALVSSKKNLVSNLSDLKLNTNKEIWVNVKADEVQLNYNPK